MIKLSDVIKFDKKSGCYMIASDYSQADVDSMLREIAQNTLEGYSMDQAHALLAANMVEPIRMTVPYVEMYSMFFRTLNYADFEDNSIPLEDIPMVSWETHRDGEISFVRANYTFTTPTFTTFDVGIEVHWDSLRRAGWNYLSRQMQYATESLARKRDAKAKAALDAAVLSGYADTVSGGVLTRAAWKSLIKEANAAGFPMTQVLVNSGTITDMTDWSWVMPNIPERAAESLITNLYLGNYGGVNVVVNPHASATVLYFSGSPENVGIHQERGGMRNVSDVDIRKKIDLHAVLDSDHAWYVGNAFNLRTLTITA